MVQYTESHSGLYYELAVNSIRRWRLAGPVISRPARSLVGTKSATAFRPTCLVWTTVSQALWNSTWLP